MNKHALVFVGLPSSGKTTYLAALWHQITAEEIPTQLVLSRLGPTDRSYLNQIVQDWQAGKAQQRTRYDKVVSLFVRGGDSAELELVVPDLAGENFVRMWENRTVDDTKIQSLQSSGVLLFVHSDFIEAPRWVVEDVEIAEFVGEPRDAEEIRHWDPAHSPTQVKLVDVLQLLRKAPLDCGPRRLVVALSAWDRVEPLGLTPKQFLASRLPLLSQYLSANNDEWEWSVYGISAQGGNYLSDNPLPPDEMKALNALQQLAVPSRRAYVVTDSTRSTDLTEPLSWVLGPK